MQYSATFPKEPSGPVWDVDGDRYDKTGHGFWKSSGSARLLAWGELVFELGPLTDVAPLDLEAGRLYAVTKDDDADTTYVCIRPHGWDDRMYVVLPAEHCDEVVKLRDIETCEPLAVVPQGRVGDIFDEFEWFKNNKRLQPGVVRDLGLSYTSGKD